MDRKRSFLVVLGLAALSVFLGAAIAFASPSSSADTAAFTEHPSTAEQIVQPHARLILSAVNRYRDQQGLSEIAYEPTLSRVAVAWSVMMSSTAERSTDVSYSLYASSSTATPEACSTFVLARSIDDAINAWGSQEKSRSFLLSQQPIQAGFGCTQRADGLFLCTGIFSGGCSGGACAGTQARAAVRDVWRVGGSAGRVVVTGTGRVGRWALRGRRQAR